MKEEQKTKDQLIQELNEAKRQIATLRSVPQNQSISGQGYEELRAERDKLQSLMDGLAATGIGVDVIGADYRIRTQNKLLQDTFGDQTGKLCYKSYIGRSKPCVPCSMKAAIKNGKMESIEMRGINGRLYEVISAPLLYPDGTANKAIEVIQDITERKHAEIALGESEGRFRAIAETAKDCIFTKDLECRYTYVNGAMAELFGCRLEDLIGKTPEEIFDPESAKIVSAVDKIALDGDTADEVRTLYLGDHEYVFHTIQVPLRNINDEVSGICGIVRDITDQKRAEAEKIRLEQQYHQSQKVESIGRLAGGVSHDLNNLLSPIIVYGELLMRDFGPDDERRKYTVEIVQAGFRARDLVHQLLAFSRKQTMEYVPVDMNKVVIDFKELLRRTIPEDIQIEICQSTDIRTIMADVGQIEQVIMNLATNAADAMPEGGRLTIETAQAVLDEEYAATHSEVQPGEYVMLSVSDTGYGFDDETLGHLFEPFYSTKGELGTGLGLATVFGIVKQHGGNIWVHSESDMGTTFKVYLPVTDKALVKDDTCQDTATELKGSETILLVEDNKHVRDLAHTILELHGYTVLVAENGGEALMIFEEHGGAPDLLLTDVVMPEMNGKELFDKAIENHPSLRVLYMSGYTKDIIADHGVLDEGIAFIQKPFTLQSLATKVRKVLDHS
ncbi:MAG: PAS domain S-box protein [Deltaproteobacteria bacterium]|nr:PAS domain S-box protein [Deltaproteobacteria bacterium]